MDIKTISLDDVEIIPTNVNTDITDLTADLIVVPPATTVDALTPITSELTYALLQNTITTSAATPVTHVTFANQGIYYTQHDPITLTKANVIPVLTQAPMPCQVTPSTVQTEPIASVPSPPKKPKPDDAIFLTPLPIITYNKPAAKLKPKPRPPNPNQNRLIKALLAQNSTPVPYVARPTAPRSTSFIIRASTQSPSGKTKFLNLPVNVSTPVSIVRNVTQAMTVRPTITHNLLVKDMGQRSATRSAFVRTSTGNEFVRKTISVPVASSHATTTTAITTPMTMTTQVVYSIPPIMTTTSAAVTTAANTVKPYIFTATPAQKTRTTRFPTYTKTYIPVPQPAKPTQAYTLTKTHNLVGNRMPTFSNARTSNPSGITMLGPRGFVAASPIIHRPHRAPTIPGYKSRHLEPGEIPQVRKMPPRTFLGPRSSVAQRQAVEYAQQQALLKVARHAEHHAESQAQLRALQAHGASRAILHATSLAALQAASHAQLEAASQARLKLQQTKDIPQSHLPATSQTQLQIHSLGQLQTVAISQPQGTLNVQLLTASQAQLLGSSKMQLIATSQAPLQSTPQSQVQETSQTQPQVSTQVQMLRTTSKVHPQAASQAQIIIASQPQFQATSQAYRQTAPQAHLLFVSQGHLQATSQAQLKANSQAHHLATSQAQFKAVSQAQFIANTQAKTHSVLQAQLQAPFRTDFQAFSQPRVLTTSQAPSQVPLQAVSHVQLLATSQPQFQEVSQAQLQATTYTQSTPNASQPQLQTITNSQAQNQATPQARLQTVSPAQLQTILTQSQSGSHAFVQPNARTHHRLIIRSAPTTTASVQGIANAAVAVPETQNEKHPTTAGPEVTSSSIHTTSTLTLSTGTTLIMPHYKTTVFKNLATIAPTRSAPPTPTAAATAENVVIRPVAYFARRTIPPCSGTGAPVNVQRHIIRTIPRHVLGPHLHSPVLQAVLTPRPPIVSTSSSELPGFTTLSQNKSQNADK